MQYYALWFKQHRTNTAEPMINRGFVYGTEYQARRALAQLRTGYPAAQTEGWWLYDLRNGVWL